MSVECSAHHSSHSALFRLACSSSCTAFPLVMLLFSANLFTEFRIEYCRLSINSFASRAFINRKHSLSAMYVSNGEDVGLAGALTVSGEPSVRHHSSDTACDGTRHHPFLVSDSLESSFWWGAYHPCRLRYAGWGTISLLACWCLRHLVVCKGDPSGRWMNRMSKEIRHIHKHKSSTRRTTETKTRWFTNCRSQNRCAFWHYRKLILTQISFLCTSHSILLVARHEQSGFCLNNC